MCYLCETKHDSPQLCFKSDDFDVPDLELLHDILGDCLWFSWEDGIHERIFLLCNYFLIDQDFCFPLFYRSLRHEYVMAHETFKFLHFLFNVMEVGFDNLGCRLLDYFNKFNKTLFIPHTLLFRSRSLDHFLFQVRNLSPTLSRKRHFHASSIWQCP